MKLTLGVFSGVATGVLVTTMALLLGQSSGTPSTQELAGGALGWLTVNLGHSVWLFGIVLVLYTMNLTRLNSLLEQNPDSREVVELDQLSDVWIHLFVGIGVIWTAVGMRAALQAALGDPTGALTDSAGNVLRKLVDGGILLALTTTIVGAVGGYLMRLAKTVVIGARLMDVYDSASREELQDLLQTARRIEAQLRPKADDDEPQLTTQRDDTEHNASDQSLDRDVDSGVDRAPDRARPVQYPPRSGEAEVSVLNAT